MELRVWQKLAEDGNEGLVRAAMGVERGDVKRIASLRKMCSDAEVVRAAMVLGEARRKAVGKFGRERAAGLWADVEGVEMASSLVVADHKATRFKALLASWPAIDLCCGIGGDAMMLAPVLKLTVVDQDPVRAWMAGMNAGCEAVCADATTIELPDGPVHIDPARREEGGRRLWNAGELRPSLMEVRAILGRSKWGGAVKLGPGADLGEIERALPGCSVEVVSERGTLVQAVAWCGDYLLAVPRRREATLITRRPEQEWSEGSSCTLAGTPGAAELPMTEANRPKRYVYEPDDSVERAGLLAVLCDTLGASMLHPRVGLLTSDAMIWSPWVSGFEVVEEMAFNERWVKGVLEARGAGIVEIKTRGGVVETDALQGRMRGRGDAPMVVFVLRLGRELRAIVAKRVERSILDE